MFYRPADGHGLPHNPFHAVVSPRPIAWSCSRTASFRHNSRNAVRQSAPREPSLKSPAAS